MPRSLPVRLPSWVTATVVCPVRSFSARMSASVSSGPMEESFATKPAL